MLGWLKKNKKKDPIETDPPLEIESLVDGVETTEQIEKPKSDQPPVPVETGEPPPQVSPEAGPQITPEESTQSVTELDELEESSKSEPKHAEQSVSMLTRLSQRLSRTRESLTIRMDELFLGKKEIDADLFDELEEILITADLGIATTQDLLEHARKRIKRDNLSDPLVLKEIIKEQLKVYISGNGSQQKMSLPENEPFVIMVVGVNGVGKTTTIGKIARKFIRADRSVLLVAADTFRAAAVSQLKIWGERNDVRVIAQQEGADPSAVVYDAMSVAKTKDYDVVLVDTAGRLHTKVNLMEELKKIKRVMNKQLEGAPHEVLLVIDATTGQNGISQAKLFNDAVGVTGVALTKLDGTAKGGIVATITREMDLPIRFIGVGEQVDDLRDFDADEFIEALFATN
ncbi:MAG: signal recognition particle-docking protein FtsY [Desulfofustis sp.]|nr:signal recognition particle-docking protein FtsY [Desulfofustis sp.]